MVDVAPDFLFLLPLGRPRPLLAGCASLGVVAANEATHKFWKNGVHAEESGAEQARRQELTLYFLYIWLIVFLDILVISVRWVLLLWGGGHE